MSSYLSNLLTSASSLRSRFSTSESDGPTPEDTHLCRVLRAYYSEQRRPFPDWLPPDPKEKSGFGRDDNSYDGRPQGSRTSTGFIISRRQGGSSTASGGGSGSGGLSDLWGDSGNGPPAPAETMSLRRGPRGAQPGGRLQVPNRPGAGIAGDQRSQSAGSHLGPQRMESVSAQDRLKARLFGGTGRVSAGSGTLSPNYDPPPGRR